MKDVNKIILVGRLGGKPVRRSTKNGLAVAHFPMATSRRVLVPEGADVSAQSPKEETQWHRVVVWGKQAEACAQYLEKGQAVYVEGMVRTRKYTHKDGSPRFMFEVHAEDVSFLSRRLGDAGSALSGEGQEGSGEAGGELIQAAEGELATA